MNNICEAKGVTQRRYDIDWLRVLAVLLLIYFHSARIFDFEDFYVKNAQLSIGMTAFIEFVAGWFMPLFFLISGSGTWFSLTSRRGNQYAGERFKRLIIPLIFGSSVIVPPQVYLMRLGHRAYGHLANFEFQGSYIQFYPHFFNGIAPGGNWEWAHLWFLAYLFVFSVLALPLFLVLRKERGQSLISGLAAFCDRRGTIFLLAIPLAIGEAALRARWLGIQNLYDDWANFFFYFTIFVYGYLLCSDARFGRAVERNGRTALISGAACMLVIFGLEGTGRIPAPGYSPGWMLFMILRAFNCWCWVLAILSLGQRYLNFNNRVLRYANEAALPFYILHQTVIVVIGYYVVRWSMGITGKYLVITTASLLATVVIYDVLVRRTNVTRFLFGLRPKKSKASQPEPVSAKFERMSL